MEEVGRTTLNGAGGLLDEGGSLVERLTSMVDVSFIVDLVFGAIKVLVLGVIVALLYREIMTYRWLRPHRRRRYVVRSASAHEWRQEDLERWASQLTSIRRRIRVFPDRPAQAVRIRLGATPRGVRYTMEGSSRIEKFMNHPTLPGVEVTPLRPRTPSRAQPQGSGPPSPRGPRS